MEENTSSINIDGKKTNLRHSNITKENRKPRNGKEYFPENIDGKKTNLSHHSTINTTSKPSDLETLTEAKSSEYVDDLIKNIKHDHGFYNNIDIYNKMYWWGYFNMRSHLTNTIEYVFFTKPDLHLTTVNGTTNEMATSIGKLIKPLENVPYFDYIFKNYPYIIRNLQSSYENNINPFNNLLFNQLLSNAEVPSLEANAVETAANRYGVNLSYRGTSESSNDNFGFSLEFKDTKWLDIYHYFKTYEEYETLKHHGVIIPQLHYIEKRILHDQFSIYKFLVDLDASTLIYWCKYIGVTPISLPRETFSTSSFDSGLSYSINFRASFFEDMTPEILADFNALYSDTISVNNLKSVDNELFTEDRNNFHTNINYSTVKAAQVLYVPPNGNLKFDKNNNYKSGYMGYKDESGRNKGRFVLDFYS